MSRESALLMSGIITTEYFLASIVQIWLVNYFKRRTLLFVSSAGEIITMVILAIMTWDGSHSCGIVAIVMIFLYNTLYAFGWLTVSLWLSLSLPSACKLKVLLTDSLCLPCRDHNSSPSS